MSTFQAVLLAVIEGVTEFLPVSSTGHMIIGSSFMGIAHDDFTKFFTVCIQFGAILSVIVLYFRRFVQSIDFYWKLFLAFLPAAILGKLFDKAIDALLGDVLVVAIMLIAGGVVFLWIDKMVGRVARESVAGVRLPDDKTLANVTGPDPGMPVTTLSAIKIGFFQAIAMIPGVSRSAATIIGGLTQGLTRKHAAEFSFFLAVPTMFAASVYKLYAFYQGGHSLNGGNLPLLILGNVVAFIVAMIAIRGFIDYLSRHGFKAFGYYRIALGLAVLAIDLIAPGWLHIIS